MAREMSPEPVSFSSLPDELLPRIFSFFGPEDTRTLRYVTIACHNTNHESLIYAAAENALQDQCAWLLDRWQRIHAKTSLPLGAPPGIELTAEQLTGKQYVKAAEVIDEADHWVSFYAALRKCLCDRNVLTASERLSKEPT